MPMTRRKTRDRGAMNSRRAKGQKACRASRSSLSSMPMRPTIPTRVQTPARQAWRPGEGAWVAASPLLQHMDVGCPARARGWFFQVEGAYLVTREDRRGQCDPIRLLRRCGQDGLQTRGGGGVVKRLSVIIFRWALQTVSRHNMGSQPAVCLGCARGLRTIAKSSCSRG